MKVYKYKLRKPSKRIVQVFEQWLSICQQLYNAGLQERTEAYKLRAKSVGFFEQKRELTDVREADPKVAAVYSQVGQDALNRLNKAFLAFFARVKRGEKPGYPRFRSRSRYDSFTYPQSGFRLSGDKLHLAKIGSVRLRLSRPVEGKIKTCTIKRQADGWFVVFAVEENQSRFIPKTGDIAGVDLNLSNFCTISTGEVIDNPRFLKQAQRRLKTAQRSVSRKKLRGSNRRKAVQILRRQHLKVANQRKDFFHKLSLQFVREFDTVYFEDLKILNLLKNHCLAQAISDVAWGTFLGIHQAKAESAGRDVGFVPPRFTSMDCCVCGNRQAMPLSKREYVCVACGNRLPRDHNASINILGRGTAFGDSATALREPKISRL